MSGTRKLAVNFGWLLGGRGAGALVTLAATVLAARALGAQDFGTIVLIHTTALVIRQLCSIKTAEAVVRFGVPLRDGGRAAAWPRLLAGLLRIDLLTAGLAALVAALVNALSVALLGLDPALQFAAWLYVPMLAVAATGTAKGALRVLDRYALLGGILLIAPLVRLAGVALALALAAPLEWYVVVWASGPLFEHLCVLRAAWRTLRAERRRLARHGLRQVFTLEPRLARFLRIVYWQSNLDVFPRHVITLLVGAWFGSSGAGVFRLARDLADVLGKPVALLRQAVFPDLSRLWHSDRGRFVRLTFRLSGVMLAAGSVFVLAALLAGGPLLEWLAGPDYRRGATLLALLLGAASLELGGAVLRPASYTLGREATVLGIQGGALAVFLTVYALLAGPAGLQAAGWAAMAGSAINLAALTLLVRGLVRRR